MGTLCQVEATAAEAVEGLRRLTNSRSGALQWAVAQEPSVQQAAVDLHMNNVGAILATLVHTMPCAVEIPRDLFDSWQRGVRESLDSVNPQATLHCQTMKLSIAIFISILAIPSILLH